MPNRVLREVLLTSRKIDQLESQEFEFYIRLMLLVDDYGRYVADPVILRSRACPLREGLKSMQVRKWVDRLAEVGLILLYRSKGESFLQITNWSQRMRAAVSRYPSPDDCRTDDGHMTVDCRASAPVVGDGVGVGDDGGDGGDAQERHTREPPGRYGEFMNVSLTKEDHGKLMVRFGDRDAKERIERLSGYLKSTGKRYKDHYATILNWARKDEDQTGTTRPKHQNFTGRNQSDDELTAMYDTPPYVSPEETKEANRT